MVFQERLCS
ncbi:unnamed protein product [Knipowitschia caucasica]